MCIKVKGDFTGKQATIRFIDEKHTNPKAKWVEQGCAEYPTKLQIQELFQASEMISKPVESSQMENGVWS